MLFATCFMLMAAACSSEEELTATTSDEGRDVVVTVLMPDQKDTRVFLREASLYWELHDKLYVIPLNMDGSVKGTVDTLYNDGTKKGERAKFKGKLTVASKYRFVVKNDNVKIDERGNVSMDYAGLTQTSLSSNEHLKNRFLITSDVINRDLISEDVHLKLRNSLLRLNLISLPENLFSITSIKWILNYGETDETVAAAIKFSGTMPEMYGIEDGRYIFIPMDVTRNLVQHAGKKMALQFKGNITRTVTVTVPSEKTYTENKLYLIDVSQEAHEGQKAMTEWDVENDYILDNQIWARVGEGGLFCVYGSKIGPKSQRGYYVYTDYNVGEILTLGELFMAGCRNVTEIVFPRQIKELSDETFRGSGLSCPLDFRQCKNLQTIGSLSFYGVTGEVLLPYNGAPLSFKSNAFDYYEGTSITIPQTTVSVGRGLICNYSNLNKLVFLPSYKNLHMNNAAFLNSFGNTQIDLTLNKDWLTPENTKELDSDIKMLKPFKDGNDKYWWMGVQWKSIRFVNVNADGTPGSEVQVWAEGDDIDEYVDEENLQNGGALTSTGMEK